MCPICKMNKYTVTNAKGYSKETINECIRCNTIWIDRDGKPDILYVNGDKS